MATPSVIFPCAATYPWPQSVSADAPAPIFPSPFSTQIDLNQPAYDPYAAANPSTTIPPVPPPTRENPQSQPAFNRSASRRQQNHAPVANDFFLDRLRSSSAAARDSTAMLDRPLLNCLHQHHFPPTSDLAPPARGAPGSTPTSAQPWVTSSTSPGLDPGRFFLSQPPPARNLPIPTSTPRDDDSALPNTTSSAVSSIGLIPQASTLALWESTEAQARAEATISEHMPRAVLDLKRRLDEHHAQSQRSFASLQGQLSKLRDNISSLTTSMIPSSAASTTTTPTPSSGSTTMAASSPSMFCAAAGSSVSSRSNASITAYVACQVFEEMPQPYGFSNLDQQSIFLADGTEHSYYALPEDYPLEQATLPMSPSTRVNVGVTDLPSVAAQAASLAPFLCSKANIIAGSESLLVPNLQLPMNMQDDHNVIKEMHVSDVSEKEKQDNEQLLKCFSKEPETEHTSVCVNILSDVRDFKLEQHQQDNEKASVNVQQQRAPPLNVLVIDETRNEWDPGDHTFPCSTRNKDISAETRYLCILSCSFIQSYRNMKCNCWLNIVLQSMGDQVQGLNPQYVNTPWDPGVLVMHSGITSNITRSTRDAHLLKFSSPHSGDCSGQAPKCFSKPTFSLARPTMGIVDIFSFTSEKKSDNELLTVCFNYAANNAYSEKATDFTYPHGPTIHAERSIKLTNEKSTQASSILHVQEATMHRVDERFEINIKKQEVLIHKHGITYPYDLNTDKEVPFPLKYQLPLRTAPSVWDPGIDLFSYEKLLLFSWIPPCVVDITLEFCLMDLISQKGCVFRNGQLTCMPQSPTINSSELGQMVKVLSRWFLSFEMAKLQWDQEIRTPSSICLWLQGLTRIATEKHLSWLPISELTKWQSQVTSASFVWDPGTMLLWWLLFTKEESSWHNDIKCYGVALWLIHFQPP